MISIQHQFQTIHILYVLLLLHNKLSYKKTNSVNYHMREWKYIKSNFLGVYIEEYLYNLSLQVMSSDAIFHFDLCIFFFKFPTKLKAWCSLRVSMFFLIKPSTPQPSLLGYYSIPFSSTVACEVQMYFRSSPLSLRKLT